MSTEHALETLYEIDQLLASMNLSRTSRIRTLTQNAINALKPQVDNRSPEII